VGGGKGGAVREVGDGVDQDLAEDGDLVAQVRVLELFRVQGVVVELLEDGEEGRHASGGDELPLGAGEGEVLLCNGDERDKILQVFKDIRAAG
jgi:hypothetical protein